MQTFTPVSFRAQDLAFVEGHTVTLISCMFSEVTGLDVILLHAVFVVAEAFREVLSFPHVGSRVVRTTDATWNCMQTEI